MTVKPGLQGQSFIEDSLNKIDQLKLLNYKDTILLDGGINNATIEIVKRHQVLPDSVCVGSYLTKTKDTSTLQEHIGLLKNAVSTLLG